MKNITMLKIFVGLILSAAADVPALINYQGRLVDGVGNPITGQKEFQLDIYDSQTEGTLIYQETFPDIALDEDGAYSFQFGGGQSRTETSVVVATGDGETSFFQTVLEQTPVGVLSVTDGTTTFTSTDTVTGEEPFTFTYTASVNRLNLICNEPPAVDVKYTASFRFAEDGITGALSSAAEHWMEVTIGGEKQTPRQRIVAVPFALRAGVAEHLQGQGDLISEVEVGKSYWSPIGSHIKVVKRIRVPNAGGSTMRLKIASVPKLNFSFPSLLNEFDQMEEHLVSDLSRSNDQIKDIKDLNVILNHEKNYYFIFLRFNSGSSIAGLSAYEIFFTK